MIFSIVDKGEIDNINYWITKTELDSNKWYCAYIEKPDELANYEWKKIDFEPHGGITYDQFHRRENAYLWGWDYAHHDDYIDSPFLENQTTRLAMIPTEEAIKNIKKDIQKYVDKIHEYQKNREHHER